MSFNEKLDFLKIELCKIELKKKKNGTQIPLKELDFHVKFLTLLDFHQIEFFIETRFSKN